MAERERGIGAGADGVVAVGELAGAVLVRIDRIKLRAIAAGFDDERPEVNVGAEDVGAPGNDELRVAELLRFDAVADAEGVGQAGDAGRGADGAVEPRGAEAMEEAAVHAGAVEQPMVPA